MYSAKQIGRLLGKTPLLADIMGRKPVTWLNPYKKSRKVLSQFPLGYSDMREAEKLWERFAPFFEITFPETKNSKGILESPLKPIAKMQSSLQEKYGRIPGKLYLKCDNALPIVGSIKARGGFFEVLHYAEKLALDAGILQKGEDYSIFTSDKFKKFFSQYKIGVGSTGNLGLSIGTISAKLGFQVNVYMSADAKTWKKKLPHSHGANVLEFEGDFSKAILSGREATHADPNGYFVDDENSDKLFLGYTVGALRLAKQLSEQDIKVDADHPLFVYSPCGVGGSPGGTAFGLKQIFGDHVHCFFVEPTEAPAVLTGLITGKMANIAVQDIGISNQTEADGLAVGRPSQFATKISKKMVSGIYTVNDDTLYPLLAQLRDTEDIFLEPSATPGLIGPQRIAETSYFENINMENATHIAWATGGDLVPEDQRKKFYDRGLLKNSAPLH